MVPNIKGYTSNINGTDEDHETNNQLSKYKPKKQELLYFNIIYFTYWHLAAIYGLYLCLYSGKWFTLIMNLLIYMAAEIGVTAGAHRLWAHRAYKAKLPLQIILMVFSSFAFQNTAMHWARDHRLHHKYSDTNGDPHNASRGFFYSHFGWLFVKKNDEVRQNGKLLDWSDIYNNPVLRFQKKFAIPFIGTVCFLLPTVIPMYFWGETFSNAWHINMFRYMMNLNATLLVNSVTHKWGYKPYDKNIPASQNLTVSFLALGEGFHNYHHAFPWDYRAAELGNNWLNLTTLFIDSFAWIGWAYDLKTTKPDIIKAKAKKAGDGTNLWGWDDKDIKSEDILGTEILYPEIHRN